MRVNITLLLLAWSVSIFLLLALRCLDSFNRSEPLKVVCYYRAKNNLTHKARGDDVPDLPILGINGSLCTHLIIGFASISNKTLVFPGEEQLEQIPKLKALFPHLRVLLSLGGGDNTDNFHEAFYNSTSRSEFIGSVLDFLDLYSFDGLDIDWEFPGWSKYLSDVEAFPLLLAQLREAFDAHRPQLLLSIAVSASFTVIQVSYKNIRLIHQSVDWINLMSYDFHDYSKYFPFVEHNAPLFKRSDEKGLLATLNTAWSAWYWTEILKVPKYKLVIGIPFYSHTYFLYDTQHTTPGSLATGEGNELTYGQICTLLRNCSNCYHFDRESMVPYAVVGSLWISFEDTHSISIKAKWVKRKGYGGCMTFDLNCDDFSYACSRESKFVLQETLFNYLR